MYHISYFYNAIGEEKVRNDQAYKTWVKQYDAGLRAKYSLITSFHRTSRDIGDKRILPFINDVFDVGCDGLKDEDVVVFTNLDIFMTDDFTQKIAEHLKLKDCGYSPRIEITEYPLEPLKNISLLTEARYGSDVFFFKVRWWNNIRKIYPLFFIGCGSWDWLLILLMRLGEGDCKVPAINYHKNHPAFWRKNPKNAAQVLNSKHFFNIDHLSIIDFFSEDGTVFKHRFSWFQEQCRYYNPLDPIGREDVLNRRRKFFDFFGKTYTESPIASYIPSGPDYDWWFKIRCSRYFDIVMNK